MSRRPSQGDDPKVIREEMLFLEPVILLVSTNDS